MSSIEPIRISIWPKKNRFISVSFERFEITRRGSLWLPPTRYRFRRNENLHVQTATQRLWSQFILADVQQNTPLATIWIASNWRAQPKVQPFAKCIQRIQPEYFDESKSNSGQLNFYMRTMFEW